MRRSLVVLGAIILMTVASYAGDISGKVGGASAGAVVWVDGPAGKATPRQAIF